MTLEIYSMYKCMRLMSGMEYFVTYVNESGLTDRQEIICIDDVLQSEQLYCCCDPENIDGEENDSYWLFKPSQEMVNGFYVATNLTPQDTRIIQENAAAELHSDEQLVYLELCRGKNWDGYVSKKAVYEYYKRLYTHALREEMFFPNGSGLPFCGYCLINDDSGSDMWKRELDKTDMTKLNAYGLFDNISDAIIAGKKIYINYLSQNLDEYEATDLIYGVWRYVKE